MKKWTYFGVAVAVGLTLGGSALAQPDSLWSRTYGEAGEDSLWSLIPTADGGWAMGGYFNSEDVGGANLLILKLSSNFNPVMDYSANYGAEDEGHGIAEMPDSGFVIAGYCSSAPESHRRAGVTCRIDREGAQTWTKISDSTDYSSAFSVVVRPNGDIATGGTFYPGDDWQDDFAIWMLSPNGEQRWMQQYGTANAGEYGLSLINTRDGGMALAGQRVVFGQHGVDSGMVMLVKTDAEGNQQWLRTYTQERCIPWAMQVIELANSGYALFGGIGYSSPDSGVTNWNAYLVLTNEQGEMTGEHLLDLDADEFGMGLLALQNGDFVLVGATGEEAGDGNLTNADCFLVRVNPVGEILWQREYGGAGHDFGITVLPTDDGGYLIGGTTSSIGAGACDFWLLKTGADPLSVPSDPPVYSSFFNLHSAFPNPFNSSTTISYDLARPGFVRLGVYDAEGRLVGTVREGYAAAGKHQAVWNGGGVGSGTYFLNLEAGRAILSKPIVLQK